MHRLRIGKPPAFWSHDKAGFAEIVLWPIAQLYYGGSLLRRRFTHPAQVARPVICIGNITMGGVGKTPVALMLAHMLADMEQRPAILSRGYGGTAKGVVKVDPTQHVAAQVGDEPLMMAADFAVYVGCNRVQAAKCAIAEGADILLMDDGLQNPTLAQDLNLLVVDSEVGFGNGALFPAGPLREKINPSLTRIHALLLMHGSESPPATDKMRADMQDLIAACKVRDIPIFSTCLVPTHMPDTPLLAYCGIGRPTKFFTMLTELGCTLAAYRAFGDHYPYQEKDAKALLAQAKTLNAQLVTTKKDMARLQGAGQNTARAELAARSMVIEVEAKCEPLAALQAMIETCLASKKQNQ